MGYETKIDRATWLKMLNNNVMSQVISDSKKYLFVGNRDGAIFIININDLEATDKPFPKPKLFHLGDNVEVNSLCYCRKFLIVGSIGVIYGLEWNEDDQKLGKTPAWEIKIPIQVNAVEVPDVNFLWICKEREILFAGCGDNNVYQIDLEDGKIIRTFNGHNDYIHCVVSDGNGRIYTASEDGTIKIWNERDQQCVATLEVDKNIDLTRPEFGSFLGSVAVKDDWLLCGGGPKLSLWHLSSLRCAKTFEFPGKVHVCDFVEGEIVVGGEHNSVQVYSFSGDLLADIPVDHTAVFSLAWQSEPIKFMSIGGYDNKLHVLKQFRFLDTKIPLYGNTVDCNQEVEDDFIEDEDNGEDSNERVKRF